MTLGVFDYKDIVTLMQIRQSRVYMPKVKVRNCVNIYRNVSTRICWLSSLTDWLTDCLHKNSDRVIVGNVYYNIRIIVVKCGNNKVFSSMWEKGKEKKLHTEWKFCDKQVFASMWWLWGKGMTIMWLLMWKMAQREVFVQMWGRWVKITEVYDVWTGCWLLGVHYQNHFHRGWGPHPALSSLLCH